MKEKLTKKGNRLASLAIFEVTILGVNSAYPVHGRHPSCQILNYDDSLFMIDCGEAAQIQLSRYSIKRNKIKHIFISHLHGDHCYGLPGLITSYSLQGRSKELFIHGPKGVKGFIESVAKYTGGHLSYPLHIIEYDTELENQIDIGSPQLMVTTFPMKHRMPTMGFRFQEQNVLRNINPKSIQEFQLTIDEIVKAKAGEDIKRKDQIIPVDKITFPLPVSRSYGYCSDTVYDPDIVQYIKGCTTIYHETTYLHDLADLAKERMHTTLDEAVDIAQSAEVSQLICGHYSSRYADIKVFETRGHELFNGFLLGEEGRAYSV